MTFPRDWCPIATNPANVSRPFPRFLFLFAALAVAVTAAVAPPADAGSPLRIVRTFFGWRDASSFKRISEYFTGRENTGGEIVLRTHPDRRDGYYFLLRFENSGPAFSARMVLQVILPDNATPKTYKYTTTVPARSSLYDIGVTGPDWPGSKVNAVAWRLDVFDDAGRTLATGKSYLWEKPAGK